MITVLAAQNIARQNGLRAQVRGDRLVFYRGDVEVGSTIVTDGMVAEVSARLIAETARR